MNQFFHDLLLSGADQWNDYRAAHPAVGGDTSPHPWETEAEYAKRRQLDIDVDLKGAHLRGIDFTGYNLREVRFDDSDCRGARFVDSDLSMAWFQRARLDGCHFVSPAVSGVGFLGASLRGARFVACSGLVMVDSITCLDGIEVLASDMHFICLDMIPTKEGQWTFTADVLEWIDGRLVNSQGRATVGVVSEVNSSQPTPAH